MTERRSGRKFGRREFLLTAAIAASATGLSRILRKEDEGSAKRVCFDSRGVMFVDGNKFLPIVMYGLPGNPIKYESWKKAKEVGINTITMFFPEEEVLGFADSLGLKTIVRLDYAFGPNFIPNKDTLERVQRHKSAIAWEVDEPLRYWSPYSRKPDGGFQGDDLISLLGWMKPRSELPLRVTTYGLARRLEMPETRLVLEKIYEAYPNIISGPDVYEDGARVKEEVSSYVEYWHEQVKAGRSEIKTVWQVTSAHSEDEELFERGLSYEDMVYQALSGIAAGARGLGFYDSPWGCNLEGCEVALEDNGKINAFGKHLEDIEKTIKTLRPLMHLLA